MHRALIISQPTFVAVRGEFSQDIGQRNIWAVFGNQLGFVKPSPPIALVTGNNHDIAWMLVEGEGAGCHGYRNGHGVAALFSGASGMGKTMAAQIIAHDLGADLLQVDLSKTISKYIG